MGEVALEAPRPPRLEDFGLTAEGFDSVPESRIGPRRALWFVAIYGTAAALVFTATLALSGSIIGAVFFGILLMAAGSVLLVPAITGLVCAMERCEHSWLCRRHGRYRAVTEYRKALAVHETALRNYESLSFRLDETFWRGLDQPQLVTETRRVLLASGRQVDLVASELDSGIDMVVTGETGTSAVRCAAGRVTSGRSLGRELVSAARDIGATNLLLVAPWGVDADLSAYLEQHEGKVIDSAELCRMGRPSRF